jgi:hypothetical protein
MAFQDEKVGILFSTNSLSKNFSMKKKVKKIEYYSQSNGLFKNIDKDNVRIEMVYRRKMDYPYIHVGRIIDFKETDRVHQDFRVYELEIDYTDFNFICSFMEKYRNDENIAKKSVWDSFHVEHGDTMKELNFTRYYLDEIVCVMHTKGQYAEEDISEVVATPDRIIQEGENRYVRLVYAGQRNGKNDVLLNPAIYHMEFAYRAKRDVAYRHLGKIVDVKQLPTGNDDTSLYDIKVQMLPEAIICDGTINQYRGKGCQKFQKSFWDYLNVEYGNQSGITKNKKK